jgi:MoaA/NifB/PqqE/SkfB family radical SAM enzyme
MKSSSSDDAMPSRPPVATSSADASASAPRRYFCNEPWIGVLAVEVNRDVTFCPCYLKLRLGNLADASFHELWNADALVAIRRAFSEGRLPDVCRGQVCAPALGGRSALTEVPRLDPPDDAGA